MVAGEVPQLGPIRRHAGGDGERRLGAGGGGQQLAPHAHQRAGREADRRRCADQAAQDRRLAARAGSPAARSAAGRLIAAIARTTRSRSASRSTMAPSMRSTSRAQRRRAPGRAGWPWGRGSRANGARDVPGHAGGRRHRAGEGTLWPGLSILAPAALGPRRLHRGDTPLVTTTASRRGVGPAGGLVDRVVGHVVADLLLRQHRRRSGCPGCRPRRAR